jgi:hypothetical protein
VRVPKYAVGDEVRLIHCPDPGIVVEIKQLPGWNEYRMTWDAWPNDNNWYCENEVISKVGE